MARIFEKPKDEAYALLGLIGCLDRSNRLPRRDSNGRSLEEWVAKAAPKTYRETARTIEEKLSLLSNDAPWAAEVLEKLKNKIES